MSNSRDNRPPALNLDGHAEVPAGQPTSSTNDPTSYIETFRRLGSIPPPPTELLGSSSERTSNAASDQDSKAGAERQERTESDASAEGSLIAQPNNNGNAEASFRGAPSEVDSRQRLSRDTSIEQNGNTVSSSYNSNSAMPSQSPFSDTIPPERRNTPSTDGQRT
jgi:hypothetical protein